MTEAIRTPFAKQHHLVGQNKKLLAALRKCRSALSDFYDPSEDKPHNPQMRAAGKALAEAEKIISEAKKKP